MAVQLKGGGGVAVVDKTLTVAGHDGIAGEHQSLHLRGTVTDVAAGVAQRAEPIRTGTLDREEADAVAIAAGIVGCAVFDRDVGTLCQIGGTARFHRAFRDGNGCDVGILSGDQIGARPVLENVDRIVITDERLVPGLTSGNRDVEGTGSAFEHDGVKGGGGFGRGKMQGVTVEINRDAIEEFILAVGPIRILRQDNRTGERRILDHAVGGDSITFRGGQRPPLAGNSRSFQEIDGGEVRPNLAIDTVEERTLSVRGLHRHQVAHREAVVVQAQRIEPEDRSSCD